MTYQTHDSRTSYRPDIDGLRAIAVLAVVLFHIDPALLPGGFAGVDIFFVISGFLITGNILKDARSPQGFSWREFYRRRILRILPVLFVVLLSVLVVGQFVLMPADLNTLSYSALASLLSAANVYFAYFLDTSYFADDSNLQPLLHLWSLGVEEQFYLLWPLLLIALQRRVSAIALLGVTLALAGASFVLAQALLKSEPMFAYYMLPTRAGELLIGALLAVWLARRRAPLPTLLTMCLGSLGLLLIGASLAWITEDLGFPGLTALPSTVGAALLIWAGSAKTVGVNRLLALRPMVLVGLISYSLYLWHWPLLAFYRYAYGSVDALAGVLLFGLMLGLSALSYRFVEKPCRQLRWNFSSTLRRVLGTSTVVVSILCLGLLLTRGYGIYALDKTYQTSFKALAPAPGAFAYDYVCQRSQLHEKDLQNPDCIINGTKEPEVLLWGDSNAAHYVGMVGALAERGGFSFRNAAHSSCPPLLHGAEITQSPANIKRCLASINEVEKRLHLYSTIVLAASWDSHLNKSETVKALLEKTIDRLRAQGKHVIILGQVPSFRDVNRKCQQKALKLQMVKCERFGERTDYGDTEANRYLAEMTADRPDVQYFNVKDQICRDGRCSAYLQGDLLYYDSRHLSMNGSWKLGRTVLQSVGLPKAFAHLASQEERDLPAHADLEESLSTRDSNKFELPAGSWDTALPNATEKAWMGTALIDSSRANIAALKDQRSDAFDSLSYTLEKGALQQMLMQGNVFHARARISSCTDGIPMVRVTTYDGMKIYKHDAVLDCRSGKIKLKGGLGASDVRVTRHNDVFTVHITQPLSSEIEKLALSIYPASGIRLDRYDAKATGKINIRIDIATVQGR